MKIGLLIPALCILCATVSAKAGDLYRISVKDIDGQPTSLEAYKGKVLLIVNVASKCGYTPQYKGLQALYEKYESRGFVVLGFPCNQFHKEEPGSTSDIKEFCSAKYHVTFPLFDKIDVNGAGRHPLYAALAGESSPFRGDITWNFNKFLVSRDGKIIGRFDSKIVPESPQVTKAVEDALAEN